MPQINLTGLSGQELRQYLDSSRARGDAAMAYSILQEMAARRTQAPEKRAKVGRRDAEPRLIPVEVEVEAEPEAAEADIPPMPNWRPPETAPKRPEPQPRARPKPVLVSPPPEPDPQTAPPEPTMPEEPPLSLTPPPESTAAAPEADLRLERVDFRPPPPRPKAKSPSRLPLAAVFVVGVAAGVGGGWWAADYFRSQPAAATIQTAALPVDLTPPPPPPLPPEPATTPEVVELPVEAAPPAEAQPVELAEAEPPAPPEPKAEPKAEPDPEPTAAKSCATEPTPADREICADPELQRLQKDLRRAYEAALAAHEERGLLRQRQLAWRDARNDVTDPQRLARLYSERIRKLEAATAEARAQR